MHTLGLPHLVYTRYTIFLSDSLGINRVGGAPPWGSRRTRIQLGAYLV